MKIVLIVALLLALFGFIYRALRPYLNLVKEFIRTLRHFQNLSAPAARPKATAEKLVQCGKCGIWIPETRAIVANSTDYCSRECVKRAGAQRERKMAG